MLSSVIGIESLEKPSELKVLGQWWPGARTKAGFPMLLRDHPLMSYKGVASWPPTWTWIEGRENEKPKGEIGTLAEVKLSVIDPPNRCYLVIQHEGSTYMGCLLINDLPFCAQIALLLQNHCGDSIREIGEIDLSYTR